MKSLDAIVCALALAGGDTSREVTLNGSLVDMR